VSPTKKSSAFLSVLRGFFLISVEGSTAEDAEDAEENAIAKRPTLDEPGSND